MIHTLLLYCFWFLNILLPAETQRKRTPKHTRTLHISVQTFEQKKGNLLITVYNSAHTMAQDDAKKAFATYVVPVSASVATLDIEIEPGTYAVLVAHDVNGNKKVDKNWLGVPIEPIGVSNNLKSKLRRPTFAESAFNLQQSGLCIPIILEKY